MYKIRIFIILLLTVLVAGCSSDNKTNRNIKQGSNQTTIEKTDQQKEQKEDEDTEEKTEPRKIACIGDSLTEGFGYDNAKEESYPVALQKLISDKYTEVKNFGRSNKTAMKSGNDPYINTPEHNQSKSFNPDTIVIMLGTNDVKDINWDKKERFVSEYKALIESYINLPSNPKIYICLPTPAFKVLVKGIDDSRIKDELIPKIKEVAKELEISENIIDLHTPFKQKKELFHDGLHPGKEGSEQIAEIIYERIY